MKIHKHVAKISQEFYKNSNVPSDHFVKQVCMELLNTLTEKELKKLFNIKTIDPNNKEYDTKNIKWGKVTNYDLRKKLQELEIMQVVEITAEINEIN